MYSFWTACMLITSGKRTSTCTTNKGGKRDNVAKRNERDDKKQDELIPRRVAVYQDFGGETLQQRSHLNNTLVRFFLVVASGAGVPVQTIDPTELSSWVTANPMILPNCLSWWSLSLMT